jgi:hypothetical protein
MASIYHFFRENTRGDLHKVEMNFGDKVFFLTFLHGEHLKESMGTGHFDSSKTSQNDLSPSTQSVYKEHLDT